MNGQTNELRRDLGLAAALAIVIGTVIGSGIFRVPQAMINSVGTVRMVFLVWVVGGALSLAGALTYAELAAAMPGAGGEYVYLTEAWGPVWGFLYSWTQMWVGKSGSIATLATAFFEYTAYFVPQFEKVWFTAGPFTDQLRTGFRAGADSGAGAGQLFRSAVRRRRAGRHDRA